MTKIYEWSKSFESKVLVNSNFYQWLADTTGLYTSHTPLTDPVELQIVDQKLASITLLKVTDCDNN